MSAFRYSPGASGINDYRVIVGTSTNTDGYGRAYRLVPGATMDDLGTLGGNNSAAAAINNRGQIAAVGCKAGVCSAVRLDP